MKTFLFGTRTAKVTCTSLTIVAFACLSGLALAGESISREPSQTFVSKLGITVPSDKASALQHTLARTPKPNQAAAISKPPAGTPASTAEKQEPVAAADPIPAKLLGSDAPVPISPEILQATNGWVVSDGSTLVAVYAGSAGDDPGKGRLAIVRQDLAKGTQTVDIVDAGDTGTLAIVDPPLGAAVETSAQQGSLTVRGADGIKRSLSLPTDEVGVSAN
jgi:hypothetical protein